MTTREMRLETYPLFTDVRVFFFFLYVDHKGLMSMSVDKLLSSHSNPPIQWIYKGDFLNVFELFLSYSQNLMSK